MSEKPEGLSIKTPEEFFFGFGGSRNGGARYEDTLPKHLPEPPNFPIDALPEACRNLALEAAEAIGCPVDFIALPMLAVCATAVGGTRVVRLKRTWKEPAVVWVAVVGGSGDKKTPAFKLAIAPLVEVQRKMAGEYEEERKRYEERLREYELEKKKVTKEGKVPEAPPNLPHMGSVLVNDATLEAFVQTLAHNPRGVLKMEDELAALIRSFDQYKGAGKGREKQVYLSGWSATYLRIDRKTNPEPLIVSRPCASIAGNIQPGMLPVLVSSKEDPEGFLARILFGYPTARHPGWTEDDVSAEAERAYGDLVNTLFGKLESLPGQPPQEVPLSAEAKELFKAFVNAHATETNEPGFPARLKPAWSKLEAYAARFALVLTMCRVAPRSHELHERVEAVDVRNALRLVDYFKGMAKRVYVEVYGERRIDRLAHDIAVFLRMQPQKRWRGQPEECFKLLEKRSKHLPPRANELRKDLEYIDQRTSTFHFEATKSNGGRVWKLEIVDPVDPVDPPESFSTSTHTSLDSEKAEERADDCSGDEGANGHHPGTAEAIAEVIPLTQRLEPHNKWLPTGRGSLERLVKGIAGAEEVALDVETYPVDDTNTALDPRRGKVRLISVAAKGVSGVIDVRDGDPYQLFDAIKGKTLIAHNAAFDLAFLRRMFSYEHDGPVFDTQVIDAVLHYAVGPRIEKAGWRGFPQGKVYRRRLSEVAMDYLGVELDKGEQTSDFGREKLATEQVDYALKDAEVLLPLKEAMMKKVGELGLERVVELESRATPAIAYCEDNGFALDAQGWREQAVCASEEALRIKAECDDLAPPVPEGEDQEDWNWGSTKQLGQALELLGATVPKHTTGNYKSDEAALKGINSPEGAVRLARAILRYRGALKRASTWGLEWFDPPKKKPRGKKFDKGHQIVVDGRVYSSFHQVVKTGRMSSSQPNLQNIPPELRRRFVAPPGRKLLIADYKQIELVTAAVVSGEEKLLEVFRRGDDVHALTARGILESDPNRDRYPVTDEEVRTFRPKAKMVSFGILYGITASGLAWRIENKFGVPTSKADAQSMIDRFLATYPTLKQWYLEERHKADDGDDRTRTLAGRLRLLDVEQRYGKWRSQYQLRLNTPIQGSAGDGFKHAAAMLWERRGDCTGNPKVVNLVHDEVVVEIDAEEVEASKGWVKLRMLDGMAEVLGPDAPVSVEISVADNWGEK